MSKLTKRSNRYGRTDGPTLSIEKPRYKIGHIERKDLDKLKLLNAFVFRCRVLVPQLLYINSKLLSVSPLGKLLVCFFKYLGIYLIYYWFYYSLLICR